MTTTPTATRPPLRRDAPTREFVPHTAHLKEFSMVDGRKILIDRRAVAFVCQRKEAPDAHCIVAFKSGSSGVPVAATYTDLKAWWRGDGANGKGA